MASCTAVGVSTKVHKGLLPTGNDWLSALVREANYGAYEAVGVAFSMTVREMAPRALSVAAKPRGRRQYLSRRTRAAMSGKVAAMVGASGGRAGDWRGANKRSWAPGSEGGPFLTGGATALATC